MINVMNYFLKKIITIFLISFEYSSDNILLLYFIFVLDNVVIMQFE